MWFSSCPWNSRQALYTLQGAGGWMGDCPTSPHVNCALGQGLRPCAPRDPLGGTTGVWSELPPLSCNSRGQ